MRTRLDWEWDALDEETSRAKVYGGWILCHKTGTKSESMVFVADREHVWHIMPPIKESEPKKSIAQDF